MRTPLLAATLALAALSLAGCSGDDGDCSSKGGVVECRIHIGWSADLKSQYMTPKEIRVQEGDKVRFVVTNDDDPSKDYNGAKSGRDNFHDVALLDYDTNGDGVKEDIEHEVPAGTTVQTRFHGEDYFVAGSKGSFKIICEVRSNPSHEGLGMWATFIVE